LEVDIAFLVAVFILFILSVVVAGKLHAIAIASLI